MARKRKKSTGHCPSPRPKGKTVCVRAYCRGVAKRFTTSHTYGKSHRGEEMPF